MICPCLIVSKGLLVIPLIIIISFTIMITHIPLPQYSYDKELKMQLE